MNKTKIVKFLSLMLALTLLCTFTACGGQEDNETSVSTRVVSGKNTANENSSAESQEEENSQESEVDLIADFEVIPKLDELPDYMLTNKTLYAKLLEKIVKIYYSGIVKGRINASNYQHRYSQDVLPDKDADSEKRIEAAKLCTVGGALEYYGYDNENYMKYYEMFNGCLPYFSYDRDANVYLSSEIDADNILSMTGFGQRLNYMFKYISDDTVERQAMTYLAEEIDTAVKNYYNDIKAGNVTSSSFKQKYTDDELPDESLSAEECTALAKKATLAGAFEYAGFYTPYSVCIDSLGYNKKSEIFTLPDFSNPDIISISSIDTELGELYKN